MRTQVGIVVAGPAGLHLAAADVFVLAQAIAAFYRNGTCDMLNAYSSPCPRRIWKVQRFSWWMTTLLHRFFGLPLPA